MSESERSENFGTPHESSMSAEDAAELERLRREAAALREQLEGTVGAGSGLRTARDVQQLEARIDSLAARNASTTSPAVMRRAATLPGSSQMRIE